MENKNMPAFLLALSFLSLMLLSPAVAHHAVSPRKVGHGPRKVGPRPHPLGPGLVVNGAANLQATAACRKTSFPDLCAATIGANLNTNVAVDDGTAIFKASLKAAIAEVRAGIDQVYAKLAAEQDSFNIDCLNGCMKYYNEALLKIEEATKQTVYPEVTNTLSIAVSQVHSCGDDFEPRDNIMVDVDGRINSVIDNALALAGYSRW